jgi:tetratricopeptide (TPR) repeat protein
MTTDIGHISIFPSTSELERQKSTNPNEDAFFTARRYLEQGRTEDAERFFKQALLEYSQGLGFGHARTVQVSEELAAFYVQRNNFAAAEPILIRLFETRSRALKPDDDLLIRTAEKLANVYEKLGKHEQSVSLYHFMLKQQEKMGNNTPAVAYTLHKLAESYFRQKDFESAEGLLIRAVAIEEYNYGIHSVEVNSTLQALVDIFMAADKLDFAEFMLEKQITILEKIHGPAGLAVASALLQLASLLVKNKKKEEAEELYRRVIAIYESVSGEDQYPVEQTKIKTQEMLAPNQNISRLSNLVGVDLAETCQDMRPYLAEIK